TSCSPGTSCPGLGSREPFFCPVVIECCCTGLFLCGSSGAGAAAVAGGFGGAGGWAGLGGVHGDGPVQPAAGHAFPGGHAVGVAVDRAGGLEVQGVAVGGGGGDRERERGVGAAGGEDSVDCPGAAVVGQALGAEGDRGMLVGVKEFPGPDV